MENGRYGSLVKLFERGPERIPDRKSIFVDLGEKTLLRAAILTILVQERSVKIVIREK